MKTRSLDRHAFAILAAALFCSGCDVSPDTIESLRRAAVQPSRGSAVATPQVEATPVSVAFHPAFPDRTDPFNFPDDSTLQEAGVDTSIKSAAHVDVVGFADLGVPRVFLSARGKTHSLAVGESIYGVEVTEIRPPAVRLRMGSLTWTATMFDPATSTPRR